MKAIIALIAATVSLHAAADNGIEEKLQNLEKQAQQVPRTPLDAQIAQTMRCARNVVEKGLGGEWGIQLAGRYLTLLAEVSESGGAPTAEIGSECQKNTAGLARSSMSREEQVDAIKRLNPTQVSPAAAKILTSLADPRIKCKKVGLAASIGVWIIAAGAKVDVAQCESTDGYHWIEASPGVAWTPGAWTIQANVNWGEMERTKYPYSFGPLDFNTFAWIDMGFIVNLHHETSGQQYDAYKNREDAPVQGVGVGLSAAGGVGAQLNITVIPLFTSETALRNTFRGNLPRTSMINKPE
jgi:hypothetical protein